MLNKIQAGYVKQYDLDSPFLSMTGLTVRIEWNEPIPSISSPTLPSQICPSLVRPCYLDLLGMELIVKDSLSRCKLK